MRRSLKVAGLGALGVLALPAIAAAQTMAVATTDLNMRMGPGPNHAVVGVIPGHHQVAIHQCTASMNWCQVSYGATTGWSYTPYLATDAQVAVAGQAPGQAAPQAQTGAPVAGIAGGALAGGLIAGPPGAIIGGGVGALATAPRAHAAPHGHVAVAGPHPHAHARAHAGVDPTIGIAGGALAGGLIGGPPGAIIGAGAGGLLAAGTAPRYYYPQ